MPKEGYSLIQEASARDPRARESGGIQPVAPNLDRKPHTRAVIGSPPGPLVVLLRTVGMCSPATSLRGVVSERKVASRTATEAETQGLFFIG